MGLFDDLLQPKGLFDDLLPKTAPLSFEDFSEQGLGEVTPPEKRIPWYMEQQEGGKFRIGVAGPSPAAEPTLGQEAKRFTTMGQFDYAGSEKPRPEILRSPVLLRPQVNVPESGSNIFEDPVFALGMGAGRFLTTPAKGLAKKATEAALEAGGWFTGGASDLARAGTEGVSKVWQMMESRNYARSVKFVPERRMSAEPVGLFSDLLGQKPSAGIFASPSTKVDMTVDEAWSKLNSSEQASFESSVKDILTKNGAEGRINRALGDWTDGMENSVFQELTNLTDYGKVKYLAAQQGLLGRQKEVIPFVVDKEGKNALYIIDTPETSLNKLRDTLSNNGLQYRTIIPNADGTFRVAVFDEANSLAGNVKKVKEIYGGKVERYKVNGEFLGAPSRSEGARVFTDTVNEYEGRGLVRGRQQAGRRGQEQLEGGGVVPREGLAERQAVTGRATGEPEARGVDEEALAQVRYLHEGGQPQEIASRLLRSEAGAVQGGIKPTAPVSATGIHYSQEPRTTLDSRYYGTGLKGAERERLSSTGKTSDIDHRIHFYINSGRGIRPEMGVGSHAHQHALDNLYDISSQKLEVRVRKGENPFNAFERTVLEHGYDGYLSKDYGMAVLLGKRQIKPEYMGTKFDTKSVPVAGQSPREVAQRILKSEKGAIQGGGQQQPVIFDDPIQEERFQKAGKIEPPSLIAKAKAGLDDIWLKFSREYEHIPKNKEFAQLRFDLLKLQKQKDVARDTAVRSIHQITKGLDKNTYDIFRRKVILDDMAHEAGAGRALRFGFTPNSLTAEKAKYDNLVNASPELQAALQERKAIWDDIRTEYTSAMDRIGFDVSEKFNNDAYFRHQVMQYANLEGIFGSGSRLKTPTGRGYLKKRTTQEKQQISELLDYSSDYLGAEYQVMGQMFHDIELANTLYKINKNYSIAAEVKAQYLTKLEGLLTDLGHDAGLFRQEQRSIGAPAMAYENAVKARINELNPGALKERNLESWHSQIPEGYTTWQPREGNVFYMVDSVPASLAEDMAQGIITDVAQIPERLRPALALGKKRQEWVVKQEVSDTLEGIIRQKTTGVWSDADKALLRGWKQWQLISPRRWFRYNARNLTGDAEAVFVGNPGAFSKTPQAVKELYEVFAQKKSMSPEMTEWFNRGGMSSTLQAAEMGDMRSLWMFQQLHEKGWTMKDVPQKVWAKYWNAAQLSTNAREAVLRYSSYLDYLEQLRAGNGVPKNYGASIKEEIDGLRDIRDKAYWLSNDLLGAYDRVSLAGQTLREHWIPFWSWQEVNMKRYKNFMKNALNDGELLSTVGTTLGVKAPYLAFKLGKFVVAASAFTAMTYAYNYSLFPEEERELPPDVRKKPHIILGRNEDGTVNYFSRLGTLGDALDWFGVDGVQKEVQEYLNGYKPLGQTVKDIAVEFAKAPINVLQRGALPFIKLAGETFLRRTTYPDIFSPGTVKDRGIYFARSLGLENEYKALAGKPSRGYAKSIKGAFIYEVDPLEVAYRNTFDLKRDFLKQLGKESEGFWLTPKGDVLYNMKLCLRYGDKEGFSKYASEYLSPRMGGTAESMQQSLMMMEPLSGMSSQEKAAFMQRLSAEDKQMVMSAYKFFTTTLMGQKPVAQPKPQKGLFDDLVAQ